MNPQATLRLAMLAVAVSTLALIVNCAAGVASIVRDKPCVAGPAEAP